MIMPKIRVSYLQSLNCLISFLVQSCQNLRLVQSCQNLRTAPFFAEKIAKAYLYFYSLISISRYAGLIPQSQTENVLCSF